jgi:hypothetical protein
LQLLHKELAGDRKALDIWLRYEAFAHRLAKPKVQVIFIDDPDNPAEEP